MHEYASYGAYVGGYTCDEARLSTLSLSSGERGKGEGGGCNHACHGSVPFLLYATLRG